MILVNYLNNDLEINVEFKIHYAVRVMRSYSVDILKPRCEPGH